MNKVYPDAAAALFDLQDGAVVLSSGFGLCGNPENLITAIHARGTQGLTLVSNNCGTTELGLGVLASSNSLPLLHHLPSNASRIARASASSSSRIWRYSATLPGAAWPAACQCFSARCASP